MDGAAVRAAVVETLGHRADRARYIRGQISIQADHSADATHAFNCSKVAAVTPSVKLRQRGWDRCSEMTFFATTGVQFLTGI